MSEPRDLPIHWPHTGRWGPGVMAAFEMADMLAESLHKGRPKDEEPHVKRAPPKKGNESGIEYIVRVDLVSGYLVSSRASNEGSCRFHDHGKSSTMGWLKRFHI